MWKQRNLDIVFDDIIIPAGVDVEEYTNEIMGNLTSKTTKSDSIESEELMGNEPYIWISRKKASNISLEEREKLYEKDDNEPFWNK